MTVLVHFPRTSLMASCPIKDATYKIIIKERFVENHVLGIGNFFFLTLSSLLILNFGIMMEKLKSFKVSSFQSVINFLL